MLNIKDVPMVTVLFSYFSRNGAWCPDGRMYVHTDSRVTTKIFEINGLPNFLRYWALLTHLRCTGAPLQLNMTIGTFYKALLNLLQKSKPDCIFF